MALLTSIMRACSSEDIPLGAPPPTLTVLFALIVDPPPIIPLGLVLEDERPVDKADLEELPLLVFAPYRLMTLLLLYEFLVLLLVLDMGFVF